MLSKAALLALALSLSGCASVASFNPKPAATRSEESVQLDARVWALGDKDREWSGVAATGSMEPVINEGSIVLLEKTGPDSVFWIGECVVFNRGDHPRVLHVVTAQTKTHVYLSGYNNRHSDGWFPKSAISARVVGQLYLPRSAPLTAAQML